ncbi:hypothetical protein SASPL_144618 [Salvia splendens]|uniref:Protein kinase domain-containing protein n=1 Tax=Salvia splendens TaxID=180675 RepID=A0A8X8WG34_SALSN|nr:hypothetical protein SASPL_144618 [Salvia splendens]
MDQTVETKETEDTIPVIQSPPPSNPVPNPSQLISTVSPSEPENTDISSATDHEADVEPESENQGEPEICDLLEEQIKPDEVSTDDCQQYDLAKIRAATDDFSDVNKLGEGGFGAVYKVMVLKTIYVLISLQGRFSNGQEIAVKRLAMGSTQGNTEFKNEVLLMARLQHRNLVRLLGFCDKGTERILVYEFLENSSLDKCLFGMGYYHLYS